MLTHFPNGLNVSGFASPASATITVGAEDTNVINVAVQLLDGNGDELTQRAAVMAYISDDDDGSTFSGTAPNGGVLIGTDGLEIPIVTDDAFIFISEADGDFDINITNTTAVTYYLVLIMPSGKLVVSGPITFD